MSEKKDALDIIFKSCIYTGEKSGVAIVNPRYRIIIKDLMSNILVNNEITNLGLDFKDVCEAVILLKERLNSEVNFAPIMYAYLMDEYNNTSLMAKYYRGLISKEEVIKSILNFIDGTSLN